MSRRVIAGAFAQSGEKVTTNRPLLHQKSLPVHSSPVLSSDRHVLGCHGNKFQQFQISYTSRLTPTESSDQ